MDKRIHLRPLEPGRAREIAERQTEVPEPMHESRETFERVLMSTDLSLGAFHKDNLVGWILFEARRGRRVYVYDLVT